MNDVGKLLQEADPANSDPGLSPDEAETMRRAMLEALKSEPTPGRWLRPLAIATGFVLAVAAVIVVARRPTAPPQRPTIAEQPAQSGATPARVSGRRQLQFSTPGGTRIIWVFNPDLDL